MRAGLRLFRWGGWAGSGRDNLPPLTGTPRGELRVWSLSFLPYHSLVDLLALGSFCMCVGIVMIKVDSPSHD